MLEQDFNVAKYNLESCIGNLEKGISMVKQMSNAATTPEQLEQTKTYLVTIMKTVENSLNKINISQPVQNHIK